MNRNLGIGVLSLAILAAFLLPASSGQAVSGLVPALPQPCAACHLSSAAGVPGTFPPLQANVLALAEKPAGRRYLVLAISNGLAGPLVIAGKRYNGVMPAQPLKDEGIARILNGLLGPRHGGFTAREVAGHRAAGAGLSGAQIARLRPAASGR